LGAWADMVAPVLGDAVNPDSDMGY
jgi:hypothetical protein